MRRRLLSAGLGVALALVASSAGADGGGDTPKPPDDRARARAAYDRGAAAHARGDHATAARELALADALVPNPVTLQAALEDAIVADDAVLAITLCDRATRGRIEGSLAGAVERARARFARRVGRLRVACGEGCAIAIDGAAADGGRFVVVSVGRHAVSTERDGRRERREIDVAPDGTADLVMADEAPAPAGAPGPVERGAGATAGPSPAWFVATLGTTLVAAGVTIGLGVETANAHARFLGAGCTGPAHGDCTSLAASGEAAELRTNALLGVTAALAAATVVAGVLTFRPRAHRTDVALAIGAGSGAWRGAPSGLATLRVTVP